MRRAESSRNGSRPVTLEESYALCKQINRRHGTTYYWSAQVLPAVKRHHVHALYAFARHADDIVDDVSVDDVSADSRDDAGVADATARRAAALADFGSQLFTDLERGHSDDPVLKAVVHTVRAFDIPPDAFRRFLRSMEMDLTVTDYATWDDLLVYMDGSAAVIGEMMLPILEPTDLAAAIPPARELGNAFQLTNFLRDIAEDLDRGRQYVPQHDLAEFGVDLTQRRVDGPFRDLMRFEIARCRELYRLAEEGLAMLPSRSSHCVATAHRLYGRILDEIEATDYQVFAGRVSVPTRSKVWEATRAVVRR